MDIADRHSLVVRLAWEVQMYHAAVGTMTINSTASFNMTLDGLHLDPFVLRLSLQTTKVVAG